MQNRPVAEVPIGPDLVRALLAEQHPDLAGLPVVPLAEGWDNVMMRLGDTLAVRLPRRAPSVELLLRERALLGRLGPGLPLPVPVPLRLGSPGAGYPWPWSVVPYLPGRPAALHPPTDLSAAATALGGFLGALHQPAPGVAPLNPVRGVPLADRDAALQRRLDDLTARPTVARGQAPAGERTGDGRPTGAPVVDRAPVLEAWRHALAAPPWAGPPVWVHGDLHPANLLVHDGRLAAVIDFGDITVGDPAVDLSAAWMLLRREVDDDLRSAYRTASGRALDAATWRRARGWALALSLAFLEHSADDPIIAGIGARTLAAVLADRGPDD